VTLHNKIFPGYQPCQLVKRRKNQRFKDHLCPRLQITDVSGDHVQVTLQLTVSQPVCLGVEPLLGLKVCYMRSFLLQSRFYFIGDM